MLMQKLKSAAKFYLFSIVLVSIFGVLLTTFVSLRSYNSQKDFLKQRIASLAVALSSNEIASLSATEEDIGTPAYNRVKEQFQDIVEVNPDITFVYATKLRDDTVYFVGDSEPYGSEDESPAGQSYDEVDSEFKEVHTSGIITVIGPTEDRWGTWYSGVAPLYYKGEIIGVLGMDIAASHLMRNVYTSALTVALPSLLIVVLMFFAWTRAKQNEKLAQDKTALLSLVADNVKTPLENIRFAAKQLATRVAVDEESTKLSNQLQAGVERVVESLNDVMLAAEQAGKKSNVKLERVDIVALVIDLVEEYKFSATSRNVSVLLGNSWPMNHVVDTDPRELKRALTSLLSFVVGRITQDSRITLSYATENNHWKMIMYHQGALIGADSRTRLAIPEVIIHHLGGTFEVNSNATETMYIMSFKLKGNEITH